MTSDVGGASFDQAFRRARELEASLGEQLRAFADAARRRRPIAAAVDRWWSICADTVLANGSPAGRAHAAFALPDDAGHLVGLDQLSVMDRSP